MFDITDCSVHMFVHMCWKSADHPHMLTQAVATVSHSFHNVYIPDTAKLSHE